MDRNEPRSTGKTERKAAQRMKGERGRELEVKKRTSLGQKGRKVRDTVNILS
jgi:hypothetical protein